MKWIFSFAAMLFTVAALAGCGGTFVRKEAPLRQGETVGVLIPQYRIMAPGAMHNTHIDDKYDVMAAQIMHKDLTQALTERGYRVKVIPVDEKTAEPVRRYMVLPRNFRHAVSDPGSADLGNLQGLFKEYGIDRLLLVEGESTVQPSALAGLKSAAIGTGIALATGSVVPGAQRPFTFTYTSAVDPNGRLTFFNREQFTKNGNFLSASDRKTFAEHAVEGWEKSQQ